MRSSPAWVLAGAILLALLPGQTYAGQFAYVSLNGENRIAVFSADSKTGALTHRHDVKTPSLPGGMTSDPRNRFLFCSLRQAGGLASFRIEENGDLKLVSSIKAGADPAYLATDRTGRFLLTAYYVAAKVTVHRIGEDGSLSEKPLQEIPTDEKAHAILPDASNKFVFVPHTGRIA